MPTLTRVASRFSTVLAQNEYLEDPAFLRYLTYMLYWTRPEYAKFVVFPHALYLLQLLQKSQFRAALKSPEYHLLLHQQQGYHWQFSGSSAFRPRNPGAPLPLLFQGQQYQQPQDGVPATDDRSPSPVGPGQTPNGTPSVSRSQARPSSKAPTRDSAAPSLSL
jgi:SOH1